MFRSFLARLPRGGRVADLGCGAGVPVTRLLMDRGFHVTGVDRSRRMLALARRAVPKGIFLRRDLSRPALPSGTFSGAVSFYATFHLPWRRQPAAFQAARRLLVPGGLYLVNLAVEAIREYTDDFHGVRMFWAGGSKREHLKRLRDAGFSIMRAGGQPSTGEGHLWVLARKSQTGI